MEEARVFDCRQVGLQVSSKFDWSKTALGMSYKDLKAKLVKKGQRFSRDLSPVTSSAAFLSTSS